MNKFVLIENNWNSKIPKGLTEIVKLENRQDHGQQNETNQRLHRACNCSPGNFFVTLSACLQFHMTAKD